MVEGRSRLVYICLVLLFSVSFTTEQQISLSWGERLALIQLRSSLGLRAREWPIKKDPCTSWTGVQCTDGNVSAINISGFRRTRMGSLNASFSVDALKKLSHLSSFNASTFTLPGSIPDWFGLRLLSLRVLDLRSCSITGTIPLTLGNLSNLVELYLSDNKLAGSIPSSLSALRNITVLDLSYNQFSGIIPYELGGLSKLKSLNLGLNSLTGSVPLDLKGLRNLQQILLDHNLLSGNLSDNLFSPLTQLQVVDLSYNGFTGNLPDVFWSLPSLRLFDVAVNNFTGALPNVDLVANASGTMANLSGNYFYGYLSPVISRFRFVDISVNYFEGSVPSYALGNVTIVMNCITNSTSQRSLQDCISFYDEKNLVFDNFGEGNASLPRKQNDGKNKRSPIVILACVFSGTAFTLLVVILLLICKCKRGVANRRDICVGPVPAGETPPPSGVTLNFLNLGNPYTYQQILQATGEFDDGNLIKSGYSGDFFRGVLEDGTVVVIKKVDLNTPAKKESYIAEMNLFSKISHIRLVPLLGHCSDNDTEKFLVYKDMPKGDLASSLFKKTHTNEGLKSLDWITRLKIATGVAEGLSYLHHECNPPLIHRDIQASSILLDDKFEVRLGSLRKACAQEGETPQTRITRLLRLPQNSEQAATDPPNATCAYDVYCFGKVLIELVTGKLGISSSTDSSTKEWLDSIMPYISIYDKELITTIIDPSLILDEDLLEEVWAMAIVARSCLNPRPLRRPLMRYILRALENPLKVVREDSSTGSGRLRATSSRGSWNAAAIFGSWSHSSSDVVPGQYPKGEDLPPMGVRKLGSQGSNNGYGHSSLTRQHSKEIYPEPLEKGKE